MARPLSESSGSIQIIVVEDSDRFREALVSFLNLQPGCVVAGTAGSAQEAKNLAATPEPTVVTLDLNLPDESGLQLIGPLQAKWPDAKIVIVSIQDAPIYRYACQKAGAHAFVAKDQALDDLVPVIQRLLAMPSP